MEKIYKIKFSSENNKEMFTHSPDHKWHILDEGKHFVIVKAKSKTDLRTQIKKSNSYSLYYFDRSYGVEGKDYTIKEVTNDYEKEPNMKKRIYKLKFDTKESVDAFIDLLPDTSLGDKKKSVFVKAKNKNGVRNMIERAERKSTGYDSNYEYCFGFEGTNYKIKKVADNYEEFEDKYGEDLDL